MEIFAVVSVLSLILNFALVREVLKLKQAPPVVNHITLLYQEEPESSEDVKVEVEPEPVSVTKKEQPASTAAWQNRNNIPWDEFTRPRADPVRKQTPGPLERPQGFV